MSANTRTKPQATRARSMRASPGMGAKNGPRGRAALLTAQAGLPVAQATPAFAAAWKRACARVETGTALVHAAALECKGLGLTGPQACDRARAIPALHSASLSAREVWYHTLQAELRALGRLPEMAPADRVRAQVIQWDLARLDPTRWGDRQRLEVGGQDGGPVPLALTITAGDARYLARDEDDE